MGSASKVVSAVFRFIELVSAAVVAGIVGQYLHYYTRASAHADSRFVFTEAIAGLSLLFSLVLIVPFRYSFYAFPVDFILFVCWMVAFGLLVNLTGGHGCTSYWYWNNWGYYWGGWWVDTVPTQSLVGTAACGKWQATMGFSFLGGLFWLFSGILGVYVIMSTRSRGGEIYVNEMADMEDNSAKQQPPSTIMVTDDTVN